MQIGRPFFIAAVFASFLAACVSLVPGADKVRVTEDESDISGCNIVGYLELPGVAQGQVNGANADAEFRNQTVGLGGNTAYVTYAPFGSPVTGVAYHCP